MRWATRAGVHIDRATCAWLIRRFIDQEAEFLFVSDPADVPDDATPFDMRGVELGHQGGDCSFETILRRYRLDDPVLWELAAIVHEADLEDDRYDAPEAPGFDLLLRALSLSYDDATVLTLTAPMLDAVYDFLRRRLLNGPNRERIPTDGDRRSAAWSRPDPVGNRDKRVVRDLAAHLRRPRRPDRRHATPSRRRETLDRTATLPPRAQFLHAATRSGGPAARHLHRMAPERSPRRVDRRHALRPARDSRPARPIRPVRHRRRHPHRRRPVRLAPAVLAIVAQAVHRVGKRTLHGAGLVAIACSAFLALAVFTVPFPLVILVAALTGLLLQRLHPSPPAPETADDHINNALIGDDHATAATSRGRTSAVILGIGIVAWILPIVVVAVAVGRQSVLVDQATFFSGTALVTFGGAYAVLGYVANHAVSTYHWLTAADMTRGIGLAETTPGPVIMVVQFVAFLGAYRHPGGLNPWVAAIAASLLTTWVTFVPCFLFVLLGAPYVERLRRNTQLGAALTGITAAVVGVIGHLALYFATHTLFADTRSITTGPVNLELPVLTSWGPLAAAIAVVALVLVLRFGWGTVRTLAVCAAVGLLATLATTA